MIQYNEWLKIYITKPLKLFETQEENVCNLVLFQPGKSEIAKKTGKSEKKEIKFWNSITPIRNDQDSSK